MSERRRIVSVSELNLEARRVLERGLGELWVSGELSRVTLHTSGHWYFTLKDAQASVSCAMFARKMRRWALFLRKGCRWSYWVGLHCMRHRVGIS